MPSESRGSFALPRLPAEIDPAWLTEVLRAAGAESDVSIAGVRDEVIGEDRGFTGVVARLHLDYAGSPGPSEAPSTLIAKFPMARRATVSSFEAVDERPDARRRRYLWAAREARLFALLGHRHGFAVPRAYLVAVDESTHHVCILLEDLRTAAPGDVLAGCSADAAGSVLDAIVPIHAARWGCIDPESESWLPRWGSDPDGRQERLAAQADVFLQRYGRELPPAVVSLVDELRTGYAAVLRSLQSTPATLLHGDLHLDNVMFEPRSAVLIDWQGVSAGPAAVDVAFFVSGSLAPEERRRFEASLLRRYHEELTAHGVRDYPFEGLVRDYRQAMVWVLAGYVGWLANAIPERVSGRERALLDAAIGDGRLVSALLDHVPSLDALSK